MLRAKFHIDAVTQRSENAGVVTSEVVSARPVYGDTPENKKWSMYTPGGSLSLTISNKAAFGLLRPGMEVWLDITPVEPATSV